MATTSRKRSRGGSYYLRPSKKAKFSGSQRFKYIKKAKPGKAAKGKSRRRWLLKLRNKLRGKRTINQLGSKAKDSFQPANEQQTTIVCMKTPPRPQKLSWRASQQIVMQRKRVQHNESAINSQAFLQYIHLDNDPVAFNTSNAEAEIPNMWNIAAGTLGGGELSAFPSIEVMKRQMLYVKSHVTNFSIANVMNAACNVSIYVIRTRRDQRDITQRPLEVWQSGLQNEDNADTNASSLQGFFPFNSIAKHDSPGMKPYQCKAFNKHYGIVGQRHFVLDAGQVVNHKTMIVYNKYMDWESTNPTAVETNATNSTYCTYMADWTVFTLIVHYGQKGEGNITTLGVTTASDIGCYTPSSINVFTDEFTYFHRFEPRSQYRFFRDEINQYGQGVPNAAVQIVQDEDGDIVVPTEA